MDNNYQDRPVVATRDDLKGHKAGHGTTVVAWIALLLAIAALALAWTAFNRTGEDLEQRIQDAASQTVQETQPVVDDTTNTVQDGTQDAGEALDAGPDGVDEDDTDTGTGATNQ